MKRSENKNDILTELKSFVCAIRFNKQCMAVRCDGGYRAFVTFFTPVFSDVNIGDLAVAYERITDFYSQLIEEYMKSIKEIVVDAARGVILRLTVKLTAFMKKRGVLGFERQVTLTIDKTDVKKSTFRDYFSLKSGVCLK
jgi:hypothetical protein